MRLRSWLAGVALTLASIIGGVAYATAPDALGGSAFPLTYINQNPINLVDGFNEMLQIINAQTVGISATYPGAASIPTSGVDTSGVAFSTGIQGNPLIQDNLTVVPVSGTGGNLTGLNATTATTLIASQTGRQIIPLGGITIMASGTAATATAIALECSDGSLIASWPIAELTNNVPVTLYASTAGPTLSSALGKGCAAGKALWISNTGSLLTTTSQITVNVPYTVQ